MNYLILITPQKKDEFFFIWENKRKKIYLLEKKKNSIIKNFQSQTKLWIMDKPFLGLDADSVNTIKELFFQHIENKGTIILSNHQETII
ncbi:MAG: hypothetical protein CM15mP22_7660 [Gammaproteobacteria bacterium]|nr:MAG: hypothetical protein CM15mP22_7660 [Gammaproteobacteria bacterium]